MAKTGFWLNGTRGKLAGATIQGGANGETIIRETVKPSNPRSKAQMIQRIIMATVGTAYSQMRAICDHSFEGLTQGAANMNKFRSYNANLLRDKVTQVINANGNLYDTFAFSPVGLNVFAVNPYQISRGSLPEVVVLPFAADNAEGTAKVALSANTYLAFINDYGLQRGDQLTFVTINANATGRNHTFHFARVILDPRNDGDTAPLATAFVAAGALNAPSARNQGEFSALVYDDATKTLGFKFADRVVGAAVIVSRKRGDSWRRSDATLTVASESGYSLGEALDMVQNASFTSASEVYLNNAGQGAYVSPSNEVTGGGDDVPGAGDDDDVPGAGGGGEVPGGGDDDDVPGAGGGGE